MATVGRVTCSFLLALLGIVLMRCGLDLIRGVTEDWDWRELGGVLCIMASSLVIDRLFKLWGWSAT